MFHTFHYREWFALAIRLQPRRHHFAPQPWQMGCGSANIGRLQLTGFPPWSHCAGALSDLVRSSSRRQALDMRRPSRYDWKSNRPQFPTLALNFTAYGRSISPPITWSSGPAKTKTYAIIVVDPDSRFPKPGVQWVVYNIPVQTTALPRSLAALGEPKHLNGLMQGVNSHEGVGWAGPHPDAGEPAHHYHFTVYALDRRLDLPPKAERLEVLAAMKGHVLAEGDLVAAFQAPPRKRFSEEQP
jgi:Raf kinase inhibitor-like YbhB/YbcL family protein